MLVNIRGTEMPDAGLACNIGIMCQHDYMRMIISPTTHVGCHSFTSSVLLVRASAIHSTRC